MIVISKRIKAVVIVLAAFVVLIYVYNLLAPRLSAYSEIKSRYSGASAASLLPEKREVKSFSDLNGFPKVKAKGFEFSSPFGELSGDFETKDNDVYEFNFENGVSMLVRDKSEKSTAESYIRSSTPDERQAVKNIYGEDVYDNYYKLTLLTLELTPDSVSLFSSVDEITAKGVLLRYKMFMPLNNISRIYNFEIDKVRGFQFGNPDNNDTVQIMLYDPQDDEYLISFSGSGITQENIDVILRSIKFD